MKILRTITDLNPNFIGKVFTPKIGSTKTANKCKAK